MSVFLKIFISVEDAASHGRVEQRALVRHSDVHFLTRHVGANCTSVSLFALQRERRTDRWQTGTKNNTALKSWYRANVCFLMLLGLLSTSDYGIVEVQLSTSTPASVEQCSMPLSLKRSAISSKHLSKCINLNKRRKKLGHPPAPAPIWEEYRSKHDNNCSQEGPPSRAVLQQCCTLQTAK